MMWDKRPLWNEKVGLKIFVKERNEACESFDLDTFKRFYRRWVRLGVYEPLDISDEVLEITMRKYEYFHECAKEWLADIPTIMRGE